MGLADRDYYRQAPPSGRPPRPAGPFAGAPVTKALLIANIAIFVIDMLLLPRSNPFSGPITEFGAFSVNSAVLHGRIWEFLTFQFLHASVGHILFNSIGLYFFGPFMERWWGNSLRFLVFYLACGVAGGLFYTLIVFAGILPGPTPRPASTDCSSALRCSLRTPACDCSSRPSNSPCAPSPSASWASPCS